ncbi:MAG: hypothetical protein DWQ58_22685 [Microcystis aeruginosa TA09]|nr:MAG: hypothetical protein DWQ58_22685 [Microcystis aeruginosa TA09]
MQGSPLQRISKGSTSCVTHQETEGDPPLSRSKVEPWNETRQSTDDHTKSRRASEYNRQFFSYFF